MVCTAGGGERANMFKNAGGERELTCYVLQKVGED